MVSSPLHENVRWLDIAVDYAAFMRDINGIRKSGHQLGGIPGLYQPPGNHVFQTCPVDQFHDKVRYAVKLIDVVHLDDIWMVHHAQSLGFLSKPGF